MKFTHLLNRVSLFLFKNPFKTIVVEYSSIPEWLEDKLKDKKKLFIVSNNFDFGVNNPKLITLFKEAINNGKQIEIICGPKILVKSKKVINEQDPYGEEDWGRTDEECENVTLDYLFEEGVKIYKKNLDNDNLFDFMVNGRDILIEQPKYLSSLNSRIFALDDSILWYGRLKNIISDLEIDENIVCDKFSIGRCTTDEMLKFEQSDEYSIIKRKIDKIKK